MSSAARVVAVTTLMMMMTIAGAVAGADLQLDPAAPSQSTIATLERAVAQLAADLAAVQAELAAVKQQLAQPAASAAARRLNAAAAAAVAAAEPATVDAATSFASGERMQSQLNPELSVTGDVAAVGGDDLREQFLLAGAEIDLQSDLDPFTRMHVVIGFHGEAGHEEEGEHDGEEAEHEHDHSGGEVEEAYLTWLHLPHSLSLTVGKKRQQFGVLNRWHSHALDQADLPWVLTESFGDHGLVGTGVSLDWLIGSAWADVNELTVEVANGDNDAAFAGEEWDRPSYVARLKSYWDLSDAAYFELGLDAAHGAADADGDLSNDFVALDASYNWSPVGRTVYQEVTVRGMLLHARREVAPGATSDSWGGYLYGQGKLSRRWIAGARVDWLEDQLDSDHHRWGFTPYLTFWQSEFVRLRAQVSHLDDDVAGSDLQFLLQATFSAGPHKHESY